MQIVRSTRGELNNTQLAVAEYLALPRRGGYSYEKLAEMHGISVRTLFDWRRDIHFAEHVKQRTMALVAESLPDIMDSLTQQAKDGTSIKATDIWLRSQGLMNPEVVVRPVQDDRSIESMNARIEQLKQRLGEI